MKHTTRQIHGVIAAAIAAGFFALPSAHAAIITQTVSAGGGVDWNANLWDSPASAPTAGNDYVTAAGLIGSAVTDLGSGTNITSRVRLVSSGTTFAGDSLTISAGTELLGKDVGTYSANIILNGGIMRWAPDAGSNVTLGGTINVAADSVVGVVQSNASTFTISSTLTGSSNLRLAAGHGATHTLRFSGDLSGYTGTFNVGKDITFDNLLTLNLAQEYNLPNLNLVYRGLGSVDRLNLSHDISVGSFSFGASSLDPGTYTAAQLNTLYGSGSQFLGDSSLTVIIPEPSVALLGGLGMLALLRRRRA